ncbi:MAG: hypothetical protein Ct9H90mP24_6870 [Methanobacteriota archaeon]|nr:MAG: hypothetical protein Ct9H90mP24_6870 [Euryarchaeota archaeon]
MNPPVYQGVFSEAIYPVVKSSMYIGVRGRRVWLEDDRSQVFMNASILALRDGQLSNGEKRILVKLAHA